MKPLIAKKAIIVLLFVFSLATLGNAQDKDAGTQPHHGKSAEEVAHELANPNTALGFLAFQLDYINYDGDLPVFEAGGFDSRGVDLGNIGFDAAIGKSFPSGLQLIGGA